MRTFRIPASLATLLLTAAAACFAPAPRAAEEPSTPGALRALGQDGAVVEMPLRHTDVAVEITAFVARVRVEQVFENPFDVPVEAVYTFPLGDRAAVDDFELVSGPRVIRGEVRERREARRTYETARAQGLVAALLEQERPNVFTQSVANLVPGYEIRVRLQTVELLDYTAGTYEFVFPLVVAPRYVPHGRPKSQEALAGSAAVPDADRITPPYLAHGYRSGHDVAIEVSLDAGVPFHDVVSPSHRIEALRVGPTRATIRLREDDRIPNKDFILRWTVAQDRPTVGMLYHRSSVDGYFALLVQPEGEVTPEEAAPKELILVLDASGSMAGRPLSIAKQFVRGALETLGPRDTFNVVAFSSDARILSPDPLENAETPVQDALQWVDDLRGEGGTEMLTGLRAALARPPDPDRLRILVFVSDGQIGNERRILAAVKHAARGVRVFTVGIGPSVNHYLLDRMANLGRGATALVPDSWPAPESLERFRAWVTRPYLTDLEIDWGALPVLDNFPERPGDLFSGQTLVLVGRYAGAAEGDVSVRGRLAGHYWQQTVHAVLPEAEPGNAALGSTWARRRIEELLTAAAGTPDNATREKVTRLGLEFRLTTPFTSFVAVDDSTIVNPGGAPLPVRQALPLPEGTFEATSLEGGLYTNVLTLAPGAARRDDDGSPNVHGSRQRDFTTTVGGVENVDPLSGLVLGNVNVDSIDAIEVVTARAAVEFGRAQGGFANVVSPGGGSDLELVLRLSKDVVAPYEPVVLRYAVVNRGRAPAEVPNRIEPPWGRVKFEFACEGPWVAYRTGLHADGELTFTNLDPGEQLAAEVHLVTNAWAHWHGSRSQPVGLFPFAGPGRYRLRASYTLDKDETGTLRVLVSNEVEFEVRDFRADEKEAFEYFARPEDLGAAMGGDVVVADLGSAMENWEEFVRRYPDSVYAHAVRLQLGGLYLDGTGIPAPDPRRAADHYLAVVAAGDEGFVDDALVGLAKCQIELGRFREASATLERFFERFPDSARAPDAARLRGGLARGFRSLAEIYGH